MAALAKAAFCDIGVNLLDPVFTGLYHGAQKHASDFAAMLERAKAAGVREVIVTGMLPLLFQRYVLRYLAISHSCTAGTVEEVGSAVSLCEEFSQEGLRLFSTVGVHPTRCNEFLDDPEGVMASLLKAGSAGKERGQVCVCCVPLLLVRLRMIGF